MNKAILLTTALLLALTSPAFADGRHNRPQGNHQDRSGHHGHQGRSDWNVNISFNSRHAASRRNFRSPYYSGYRSGLRAGSLFTTGLIGNYSAVPYPHTRVYRPAPVYQTTNIIHYGTPRVTTTFTTSTRPASQRLVKDRFGRCYEKWTDAYGREVRKELQRWECNF